jgi:oligopeptide/dipeptide ABC transporter ATP-binding protein
VGINDPVRRLEAYPEELSGGMAQRVLIAMALACSPKLLIADEPTSGLDVTVQAQILEDLAGSVAAVGSGLLLVTQDLSVVANYCDHTYYLYAGEVAEHAPTDRFFAQPSHPGAVALLAVQRRDSWERFRLRSLPVDGRRLPPGCFTHPRCPFARAEDGCMTVHPELRALGPGHEVRCHRAEVVREEWSRESSARGAGV